MCGVAKTVANCFKYQNKIGIDVAIEALRDARREKRCMIDALRFGKICRVGNVMHPYLEKVRAEIDAREDESHGLRGCVPNSPDRSAVENGEF